MKKTYKLPYISFFEIKDEDVLSLSEQQDPFREDIYGDDAWN